MTLDVALASCTELPKDDPDEAPLLAALRARGVSAASLAWDDPSARFDQARVTLLRSTWNYHRKPPGQFARWISEVSTQTRLFNDAEVVLWNMHKRYLLELQARGVPVVPTELVAKGASLALSEICERRGWGAVVIKPGVSAGSRMTKRFAEDDRASAEAHLRAVVANEDALVQPYASEIEKRGERSLVWIDGEITHALRKAPRFAGEKEGITAANDVSAEEREVALRAVQAVGKPLFYARVDLIALAGSVRLMELELIEPSLYFGTSRAGLERFVDGVVRRMQ